MSNKQITFSRVTNLSESMMKDCYYVIAQTLPHLAEDFYYCAQRDVNRNSHIMFVAETPCMVVGVLKGFVLNMEDGTHAQIDCLAVDKKFRRKGIGKKLLQAYEDCVREQFNVPYIALKSSIGGLDFYANHNYVRTGTGPYLKKYFSR